MWGESSNNNSKKKDVVFLRLNEYESSALCHIVQGGRNPFVTHPPRWLEVKICHQAVSQPLGRLEQCGSSSLEHLQWDFWLMLYMWLINFHLQDRFTEKQTSYALITEMQLMHILDNRVPGFHGKYNFYWETMCMKFDLSIPSLQIIDTFTFGLIYCQSTNS